MRPDGDVHKKRSGHDSVLQMGHKMQGGRGATYPSRISRIPAFSRKNMTNMSAPQLVVSIVDCKDLLSILPCWFTICWTLCLGYWSSTICCQVNLADDLERTISLSSTTAEVAEKASAVRELELQRTHIWYCNLCYKYVVTSFFGTWMNK